MKLQRFALFFWTDHGNIEIECQPSEFGNRVGFHYKSDDGQRYHNGPITVDETGTADEKQLRELLRHAWVEPTSELLNELERAAYLVKALADNTAIADTTVLLQSDECGGERFGPHHDLNHSLAAISRLVQHSIAADDGVQRLVGVIVNDEGDWKDDDDDDEVDWMDTEGDDYEFDEMDPDYQAP